VEQNSSDAIGKLRVNKSFKAVNLLPGFTSVPATSHLFDLVSDQVQYPNLDQESAQYETSTFGYISKGIGSFFGRGKQ
jgi:hypothetical protein